MQFGPLYKFVRQRGDGHPWEEDMAVEAVEALAVVVLKDSVGSYVSIITWSRGNCMLIFHTYVQFKEKLLLNKIKNGVIFF